MSTQEIITEALRLPRESRALLAEQLLESLDCDGAFVVSPEWRAEIQRRCEELDSGAVKLILADEVFTEAEKILASPSAGCDSKAYIRRDAFQPMSFRACEESQASFRKSSRDSSQARNDNLFGCDTAV